MRNTNRVLVGVGAVLCFLAGAMPEVQAATLQWDRNAEADLKEYEVYTCTPNPTCTVLQAPASRIGVVPQSVGGVSPTFVMPANGEGKVAVSASDTAGNKSGLSVSVPFDSKAPLTPAHPQMVP